MFENLTLFAKLAIFKGLFFASTNVIARWRRRCGG